MQKYDEQDEWGKWASEMHAARKRFLAEWLIQNKGNFDNTIIINALKSHEQKMCTHDYDAQAQVHYGICWSWILSHAKMKPVYVLVLHVKTSSENSTCMAERGSGEI